MLHNEARKLLVGGYEATHNAEAIAKIFHVNKYTVYHLEERKRKIGSVDPANVAARSESSAEQHRQSTDRRVHYEKSHD